jgi:hypothetical protein
MIKGVKECAAGFLSYRSGRRVGFIPNLSGDSDFGASGRDQLPHSSPGSARNNDCDRHTQGATCPGNSISGVSTTAAHELGCTSSDSALGRKAHAPEFEGRRRLS